MNDFNQVNAISLRPILIQIIPHAGISPSSIYSDVPIRNVFAVCNPPVHARSRSHPILLKLVQQHLLTIVLRGH